MNSLIVLIDNILLFYVLRPVARGVRAINREVSLHVFNDVYV